MNTDITLIEFLKFLKTEGYSHMSLPLNTRHADMYVAYKAGIEVGSKAKKKGKKVVN